MALPTKSESIMNSQIVAAIELLLEAIATIDNKPTRLLIVNAINELGQIAEFEYSFRQDVT